MSAKWWAVAAAAWFVVFGAYWLTMLQPVDAVCMGMNIEACELRLHPDLRPFGAAWLVGTVALAGCSLVARSRHVP